VFLTIETTPRFRSLLRNFGGSPGSKRSRPARSISYRAVLLSFSSRVPFASRVGALLAMQMCAELVMSILEATERNQTLIVFSMQIVAPDEKRTAIVRTLGSLLGPTRAAAGCMQAHASNSNATSIRPSLIQSSRRSNFQARRRSFVSIRSNGRKAWIRWHSIGPPRGPFNDFTPHHVSQVIARWCDAESL
jgi:hypothetical protein